MHYARVQRNGSIDRLRNQNPPACVIEECPFPPVSRGMCAPHYGSWLRTGDATLLGSYHLMLRSRAMRIRQERGRGDTLIAIAARHGVSESTVSLICSFKRCCS